MSFIIYSGRESVTKAVLREILIYIHFCALLQYFQKLTTENGDKFQSSNSVRWLRCSNASITCDRWTGSMVFCSTFFHNSW